MLWLPIRKKLIREIQFQIVSFWLLWKYSSQNIDENALCIFRVSAWENVFLSVDVLVRDSEVFNLNFSAEEDAKKEFKRGNRYLLKIQILIGKVNLHNLYFLQSMKKALFTLLLIILSSDTMRIALEPTWRIRNSMDRANYFWIILWDS